MAIEAARQIDRTWRVKEGFRVAVALAVLALAFGPISAGAQGVDCSSLRAEMDGSAGDTARSDQFAAALHQRQAELARTRDYAESIGCDSGFLFGEPSECDAILGRIEQIQQSLAQLQQQAQSGDLDNGWRHRALAEQYNTFCRTNPDAGTGEPAQSPRLLPIDPDASPSEEQAPAAPQQQVKALCVRQCDGGFFPITDQATPDKLEGLGQLCQALCPNAQATLYTTAPSGGVDTAVAPDGTPYTALPAAYKYQKTYDATCSCKPPNQSWVQALAEAEKLLEPDKSDVVVTETMSESMSRPIAPPAARPSAKRAKEGKVTRKLTQKPSAAIPEVAAEAAAPPAGDNAGEDVMRQLRRAEPTL